MYAAEAHNNQLVVANLERELSNPICKHKVLVFERNATAVIQEVDNVAPAGDATSMPAGARVVDVTCHNQQLNLLLWPNLQW
jgi:NADPH-dependent ferric siderophore reductase